MSRLSEHARCVDLEGAVNLRDIGGYHTKDGTKTIKWGVLYRGGQLSSIPADVAQQGLVKDLHIHFAYDVRCKNEVCRNSYNIPNLSRFCIPIDTHAMMQCAQAGECGGDTASVLHSMQDIYRQLVRKHGRTIGNFIKSLLSTNPSADNASLIHCAAGKDRTGWAIYVLLTLLDITEEEKRADYMLTNACMACPKKIVDYLLSKGVSKAAVKALWSVFEEFLDAAIDEVEKLGGMDAYAKSHMGLTDEDIHKLREVLLE